MKRRIGSFLLVLLMLFTIFPTNFVAAEDKKDDVVTVKMHYTREDKTYDGWDVWIWADGQDGKGYELEKQSDGSAVATIEFASSVTSFGYIIRTTDWSKKDVDADQFVDITDIISGTVDIYVTSGVKGEEVKFGEDAVAGVSVKKATYSADGIITVAMTKEIENPESAFKVSGKDGEVKIDKVEAKGDNTYALFISEKLDSLKQYTITFNGQSSSIVMPSIYSQDSFEKEYTYTGNDLGATWTKESTSFRLWAPTADSVSLNLYKSGTEGSDDLIEKISMQKDVNGTWVAKKDGDCNGIYYTYSVDVNGNIAEACDPYARTTGVNGKRAMVIDLDATDPEGWDKDADPHAGASITDAVIYEAHIRDLSIDSSSGVTTNAGKYLGVAQTGTKTAAGTATGLDHMKELGITHLHILPFYDYGSVDETTCTTYNWGYDPVNYNVPEGSYSTDPYNGQVRVEEVKKMVQTLHNNDISVVMDVVYNHVYSAQDFCFNKIVPGYFSRVNSEGVYSNGSGCGNDTASERAMVSKYIVDSVCYWADEYHLDGFRFDLVGLIDTDTINKIVTEVHKTHPNVIFYGEGWTMDTSLTKEGYTMATQVNSQQTPGFAFFNDNIRNALKGSVFDHEPGYVSGSGKESDVQEIIKAFMGASDWCKSPSQTINYASCHDNNTMIDRIALSRPEASKEELIKMNNLAAAIYLTSEGVPFMQAGEEMLRSKVAEDGSFVENSYNSSDKVNSIKWNTLDDPAYKAVFEYYKGLISFRKAHSGLRLSEASEVQAAVTSIEGLEANVVAFRVKEAEGDIFLIFNANEKAAQVTLPEKKWDVYVNSTEAGTKVLDTITDGKVEVAPVSAMILVQNNKAEVKPDKLSAPAISKVVNVKTKKAKVTWKKVSEAAGYQVQYSLKKNFKSAKSVTVSGAKKTSATISKLTKGKTYYIRVRAYKVSGGKKSYSAWSKAKSVKIKK